MNTHGRIERRKAHRGRTICRLGAVAALGAAILIGTAGCNEEDAWATFRSASRSNLESGVNSLLDGVVSGLFAIYDMGTDNSSSSSSGSSASGGTSGSSSTGTSGGA